MSEFITFEGIEGCGKTTQVHLLAETLRASGEQVLTTREPGGCDIADKIRAILLDAAHTALTPLAELLLYAAARAQHVTEIVRPALAAGATVLCDRFTDATLAYQGYARGLSHQQIRELNRIATDGIEPWHTFLIDCPVDVGISRATARIAASTGPREERFEQEKTAFHHRVRQGYLDLAGAEPERFTVIDGLLTPPEIHGAVYARLTALRMKNH